MKSMDYFAQGTSAAKKLIAAEKKGEASSLDFSVFPTCIYCKQISWSPMKCSACKAVIYCSQKCSREHWLNGGIPRALNHKQSCSGHKRQMLRLPSFQSIVLSFPWGRLESDGTFNEEIARGRFNVLGGSDFGFWSQRGGPVSHANQGRAENMSKVDTPLDAILKPMLDKLNHMDGKDLLRDAHLTDVQGWKLPPRLIPHREFFSSETRPELVTTLKNPMDGWDAWYSWRKLSKESPAALLMNYPLSAYWMLTNCLNLTSPGAGSPSKRVPLHIHLIGAEVELNYIPLFSELALLLPYHDLKLVVFGQSVHGLVQKAKQSHPKSLAGKSSVITPVYTYKAPEECGSGTVEVFLHGSDQIWDPQFRLNSSYGGPPDGLIAFNAGLTSYAEWIPVIRASHIASLPFAVTEYTEHSAELQRSGFPIFLGGLSRRESDYRIEMNPFQRPGQRSLPSARLPNAVNGFTIVVWKLD